MIGETHTVKTAVGKEKLACTVGSGILEVYATPMMAALMEQAASELLQKFLEPGKTSVGTVLNIEHSSATPCGMEVSATAKIVAEEGRRVDFELTAQDAAGPIGKGTHSRVIVDSERFQGKANAKLEA